MEVCTKNILHRFIDGPTHFGMTRGAKMSSTLNELGKLVKILLQSEFKHYLQAYTTSGNCLIEVL